MAIKLLQIKKRKRKSHRMTDVIYFNKVTSKKINENLFPNLYILSIKQICYLITLN
jgi:hypothetical protein